MKAVRRSDRRDPQTARSFRTGNFASGIFSDVAIVFAPPGIHGGSSGFPQASQRQPAFMNLAGPPDDVPSPALI